jgi:galactokinase
MRDVRAEAPGRVNLIGEHTDYHDGFVLPCAVPQRAFATLQVHAGGHSVRATSAELPEPIAYQLGEESAAGTWGDYIKGLTWVLREAGFALGGFDLHLHSEIPLGSGLSSSAAVEIATMRGLRSAFNLPIGDVELARLAHRAEVEFVGAPVGIMDQMASSLAGERHALFLDTRTLRTEQIPLPPTLELLVINSGVTHQHAAGDYGTRRRESEEAARLLGVTRLRDAGRERLPELGRLPEPLGRRARHVITENARVLEACDALRRADLPRLGRLFSASHLSMRVDYEVSVPLVDLLVDLTEAHGDVFGARMTGGGFGGAIVAAVAAGHAGAIGEAVAQRYRQQSGRTAEVMVPRSR